MYTFIILHHHNKGQRTNIKYLIKTISTGTYRKWTDEMEQNLGKELNP